ncbi:MAG: hypothetical protein EG825_10280 [Rhodocyclaceae bacterium]|nr:hypothetical protein [Rhodocyclaceae bacterium]
MDKLNVIQIKQTLTGRTVFGIGGAFVRLIDSDAPVTVEYIKGGQTVGRAESVLGGFATETLPFDGIAVTPSAPGSVSFMIADAAVKYDRFAGNLSPVPVAMSQSRATVLTSGVTTLLAAKANRKYLFIQNNSDMDTVRVTVDGSAPTAVAGMRLKPGASFVVEGVAIMTGAINAIAETGAGASVEMVEG